MATIINLVAVGYACHSRDHAKHVHAASIHAHLGGVVGVNGVGAKHKLKHGIVDAGEVAGSRRLVLLRAQGEGVHVDTGIGVAGVVLEGLHGVEVRSLALGESVLAVKLKLGGDDRVITPAVHGVGSLGKHDGGAVSYGRLELVTADDGCGVGSGGELSERVLDDIKGVSVVEGLGTQQLEEVLATHKRVAVVNVGIRLHNPHKFLARVVEVKLDAVGGRTHRFITSELHLLDEVLVGVLGHLAALIGIKEDVVHVQRSSHKGLLVGGRKGHVSAGDGSIRHSPQAFADGAEIEVDLHLVVLKGNQGQSKPGVVAEPELKRDVKGGLRKSLAESAGLCRHTRGGARAVNISTAGGSQVGKLGGVTNHLVVATLLLRGHGKLVPDVHPVTVLAVDALATDLNLNLGDKLLTHIVQPAGSDTVGA